MQLSREAEKPLEFFFRVEATLDPNTPSQTLKQRAEQLTDQLGVKVLEIPGVIGVRVKERGLKNTPFRPRKR